MTSNTDQFKGLFDRYLPYELSRRFCVLLDGDMKRWSKIDPWKVWGVESSSIHHFPISTVRSLHEYGRIPPVAKFGDESVLVLCCGHASSELRESTLAEVLTGNGAPFPEGFVCAFGGRLGFVFNHDGDELILCEQPPLTFSSKGLSSAAREVRR